MKTGEFGLIDKIKAAFADVPVPDGASGIGDDCAVIPELEGMDSLISTDMLVEDVHFLRGDISPYQLGWKSAAVNFSDIAGMGGMPVGSYLSLALPADLPDGWIDGFVSGYHDISLKYGFPLLGGDTAASKGGICICVTVQGRAARGRAVMRGNARAGDAVCVTGCLGDSACGLDIVLRRRRGEYVGPRFDALVSAHYMPHPQIESGIALASSGAVHSMMDISDGVASDLRHILRASRCSAVLDFDKVPVSGQAAEYCRIHGEDVRVKALCGGEDYQLLFTADPASLSSLGAGYHVIGYITGGDAGEIRWENLPSNFCVDKLTGFTHF